MSKQLSIARFQYLTQDLATYTHEELVDMACRSGIKWIQLRIKKKSFDEVLQTALLVKKITDCFNVVLIINDYVSIAKEIDAHGVHLGKDDMSIAEARHLLGNKKIIGATANNLEDCIAYHQERVNYIGLGPYQFTSTKEKLSPTLGSFGYKTILNQLKKLDIYTPIIAIGGIQTKDVRTLLSIGLHGIAVSSALHKNEHFMINTDAFLNQIY